MRLGETPGLGLSPTRTVSRAEIPAELQELQTGQVEPCGPSAGSMAKLCELEAKMHGLIYLIGLIVVILAILSFFGLR
jgi:hypothetical protein